MAGYYVVTLNCGTRAVPDEAIKTALGGQDDWLRFANGVYYVYSRWSDAAGIYKSIKPLLHQDDFVLVSRTEAGDLYGWGSQIVVDWFAKTRV